ncbi:MAG TPA: phospholipid carrier-dependent glycosyltransferase [Micromonosporaceae bacterium]|nr:phospholipid carrier-dependent glycosyltransferase [Micromonosporaceae bacterium]
MTLASTEQSASVQSPRTGDERPEEPDPRQDAAAAEAEAAAPTDPPGTGGVPGIIRRRLAPFDARLDRWSWVATGVVVLIAALLRLSKLGQPKGKIFDEIYYARDGWALVDRGVEWNYRDDTAAYVVHPPLGKWLIGLGEWAFGYADAEHQIKVPGHLVTLSPEVGWRISAALFGILSVLILVRVARRLFGSTMLGCTAGLLMAFDGFHLVLSRTALLDIFLLFFVLAAFGALVVDRDARRRRWLRAMEAGLDPGRPGRAGRPQFTLRDGVPWWRLLAAALLGCAIGVKWSALAFVPVFVLLVYWWEIGARRSAGVRHPWRDALLDETGWVLACAGLVVVVYLATWSGWFLTDDGYFRDYLSKQGVHQPPFIEALWNLGHYHAQAFGFHRGLDTAHTYQSWPWQWLLLGRPVAFHWSGDGPCGAASCASEVLLLGTPILWWSFLPALAATVWLGIARRDWRAGTVLVMVGAALLPWFWFAAVDGRTMFSFYTAPALPFLILAVVYVLGAMMSPAPTYAGAGETTILGFDRRSAGALIAGAYVLVVALCFAYFYPIFVGEAIPHSDWSARMWLGGRWI